MSTALATTVRDAGKRAGGRGPGANGSAAPAAVTPGEYRLIAVELLIPTADNPRVMRKDAAFAELVESIKSVGVLQPLIARPMPLSDSKTPQANLFDLRAGHRRLDAAKAAGLSEVPVIVREMDDKAACEVTVTENLQRENLHPLEEGRGVQHLLDVGWDVHQIADRLGKTATWVARRAKISSLIPAWQKLAESPKSPVSAWSGAMLECVGVLTAESQKAFLDDLNEWNLRNLDLRSLRESIQREVMHRLHGAPFSPADATLVPKTGSCLDCAKRSGRQPTLFEEKPPKEGTIGEKESCLDVACYQAKADAHVQIQIEKAKAKHGEKLVARTDPHRYGPASNDENEQAERLGLKTVDRWHTDKAAKSDPKAVPAIDLSTGAVTYVKPHRATSSGGGNGAGASRSAAEDRDARRKRHVLKAIRHMIAEAIDVTDFKCKLMHVRDFTLAEAGRVVAAFGTSFSLHEDFSPIQDEKNWSAAAVLKTKAKDSELSRQLIRMALPRISDRLRNQSMQQAIEVYDEAAPVCELLGLDLKDFEDAAQREFPEPAKKKSAAPTKREPPKQIKSKGKAAQKKQPKGQKTAAVSPAAGETKAGVCRQCGCTDDDCERCVKKTGRPCSWVEPDLCSACAGPLATIVSHSNGSNREKRGKRKA